MQRRSATDEVGEGRERGLRWLPVSGYVVAQALVLFAFTQPLLGLGWERLGTSHGGEDARVAEDALNALLFAAIFTVPAALLVGLLDGIARRARRTAWRIAAAALVIALGLWAALWGFGAIVLSAAPSSSDPVSVPFAVYLASLAGMEAALALEWATARLLVSISRAVERAS